MYEIDYKTAYENLKLAYEMLKKENKLLKKQKELVIKYIKNEEKEGTLWSVNSTDKLLEILEATTVIEEVKPLTQEDIEALGYACGQIKKCFEIGWNKALNGKQSELEDHYKHLYQELKKQKDKVVKYIKSFEYYIPEDNKNELLRMLGEIDDRLD